MSLDLTILADDGRPGEQIPIGPDSHYDLMQLTKTARCVLLNRLDDYYADARFEVSELDALSEELQKLLGRDKQDDSLAVILDRFLALANNARACNKPILALAD